MRSKLLIGPDGDGHSRRFCSYKQQARLAKGRTLLATILAAAIDAFEQVRVVVNA